MTKLSDLGPPIPGVLNRDDLNRSDGHFYNCPNCGQRVDQRDLRQVFYHEGPGHEPLEPEPEPEQEPAPERETTILKFTTPGSSK